MEEVLDATEDRYGGVVVDASSIPVNEEHFRQRLQTSMRAWKGRKGVWLILPVEKCHLIQTAIQNGFELHHTDPTEVFLVAWPAEGECKIPHFAYHYAGTGSIVLNKKKEILLVKEKHKASGEGWKIITGGIHPGEDIYTAAVREVHEETGVRSRFISLVGFNHIHEYYWGRTDAHFVCLQVPTSDSELEMDASEVTDCRWMKVEEFYKQDLNPFQKAIAEVVKEIVEKHFSLIEEENSEREVGEFVSSRSDLVGLEIDIVTNGGFLGNEKESRFYHIPFSRLRTEEKVLYVPSKESTEIAQ